MLPRGAGEGGGGVLAMTASGGRERSRLTRATQRRRQGVEEGKGAMAGGEGREGGSVMKNFMEKVKMGVQVLQNKLTRGGGEGPRGGPHGRGPHGQTPRNSLVGKVFRKKGPDVRKASRRGSSMIMRLSETARMPDTAVPKYMLRPNAEIVNYWAMFVLLLVMITAFLVPWTIAFQPYTNCEEMGVTDKRQCLPGSLDSLALAVDFFFLLDIIICFRTGFVDQQKVIVMEPKKVAGHYIKTWLIIDLVASIPFDRMAEMNSGANLDTGTILYLKLFKLPKFLRIGRVLKRLEQGRMGQANLTRVAKLMFAYFVMAHWIGCLWWFIAVFQMEFWTGGNIFTGGATWVETKLPDSNDFLDTSTGTRYVSSLYWALTTMTTVGYGDIVPRTNMERSFAAAVQLLGWICNAIVFGNVGALILELDSSGARYKEKQETIGQIINLYMMPPDLAARLRMSVNVLWKLQKGLNSEEVLDDLPGNLQAEILMQSQTGIVQKAHMFKGCPDQFVRSIVVRLRAKAYFPELMIVRIGQPVKNLYFISKGWVQITGTLPNDVIAVLGRADYFGESIFTGGRSIANVQAITYVDAFLISKADMEEILHTFPEVAENVIKAVTEKSSRVKSQARMSQASTIPTLPDGLYQQIMGDNAAPELKVSRSQTQHSVSTMDSLDNFSARRSLVTDREMDMLSQEWDMSESLGKVAVLNNRVAEVESRVRDILTKKNVI